MHIDDLSKKKKCGRRIDGESNESVFKKCLVEVKERNVERLGWSNTASSYKLTTKIEFETTFKEEASKHNNVREVNNHQPRP